MTVTTDRNDVRAHVRYKLAQGVRLPARLEWSVAEGSRSCEAEIVDLSLGGVRLRLDNPMPDLETLRIDLNVDELGVDFGCHAKICWVRRERDCWTIGCAFESPLPADILHTLACSGHLDRRTDERFDVRMKATFREELADSESREVTVHDYSSGGFRCRSATPTALGQRILLGVFDSQGQQFTIAGRALWQVESDDGYDVGCCFLNGDGYAQLAALVGSRIRNKLRVRGKKRPMRMSTLGWIALVTLVFALSQHEHLAAAIRLLWDSYM